MSPPIQTRIRRLRKELAALEAREQIRNRELSMLHARYLYNTVGEFVQAVRKAALATSRPRRRRRHKVTPAMLKRMERLLCKGCSAVLVAKVLNVSVPTVHARRKRHGWGNKKPATWIRVGGPHGD